MEWIVKTENETKQVAKIIAPLLQSGDVVALQGTLGVGKTTFTRALVQYLTHEKTDVPSPTFTLLQTYETPDFTLYHFDFYRLKSPQEAYEVGIEDAFEQGVSVIEWPEKIGRLMPKRHKTISFEIMNDGSRKISTQGF